MATPISKFRKAMDGFLDKLVMWASDEQQKELEKFRLKYEVGMKVNPREVLNLFMEHTEQYAEQILSGNDEYFLKEHLEVEDEFQDLIVQLKRWWPALDQVQQKFVKDQTKLLLMLGAIATKNEPIRLTINKFRAVDNPLLY